MTLYLPGPGSSPPRSPTAYKSLPNINIVRHGGRLLALE